MYRIRLRFVWADPETFKNNIKMANPRSAFLFSKLPDEIKIVLGDKLSEDIWEKIKNDGALPACLADLEIESEQPRMLRNPPLADDTHLIEQTQPEPVPKTIEITEEEEDIDILENLLSDKGVHMITDLHEKELLK